MSMRVKFFAALLMLWQASAFAAEADWEASARKADHDYWAAYNRVDPKGMNAFLSDDVEFYHDRGGKLIGKKKLAAVNNGMSSAEVKLRREEIPGTLHFFPMREGETVYGAMVTGEHQFFLKPKDGPEQLAGRAYFTQLMLLKGKEWKISRIFSYEHVDAAPAPQ